METQFGPVYLPDDFDIPGDEGYYYPDFNVDMGAKQLQNAILNHKDVHDDYMRRGREFVAKYSPYKLDTLNIYQQLINDN